VQAEPDLGDAVIAMEMSGSSICCRYPIERIVGTIATSVKNSAEVPVTFSSA
jgi:hypothetical protein